jgi:hypothetical protein
LHILKKLQYQHLDFNIDLKRFLIKGFAMGIARSIKPGWPVQKEKCNEQNLHFCLTSTVPIFSSSKPPSIVLPLVSKKTGQNISDEHTSFISFGEEKKKETVLGTEVISKTLES